MALGKQLRVASHINPSRPKRGKRQEWLHKINVMDFLETMDVLNTSHATADEVLFSCPFPGHSSGDSKPSAYMNDGSKDKSKATVWKCHGCGRQGNAISFYAEIENVTKQEAAQHLRAQYAPDFREPKGGSIRAEFEQRLAEREQEAAREREPAQHVIPRKRYDDLFGTDWEAAHEAYGQEDVPEWVSYVFERGFTVPTLEAWDIGYDPISDRITIAIHNPDGDIIGVKGRSWKSKKKERIKYLILGDRPDKRARYGFPHYEKSLVIFGLHMWAGKTDSVVLVEGELDAIALWQVGIPAISTGSAHLSAAQARLIRDHFDEVIVFYDIDEGDDEGDAGYDATWGWHDKDERFHPGVVQILIDFMRVKVVAPHDDDASQMVQDGRERELRNLVDNAVSAYRLMLD